MQVFSIDAREDQILCNTARCQAVIRRLAPDERIGAQAASRTEVVLCVIEGGLDITAVADTSGDTGHLQPMQGVQIPAGQAWSANTGKQGARIMRVDSPHPGFDPAKHLMPSLAQPHYFAVADGQKLVYTDYVRGGVLTFAPHYVAERHFHQDADEVFWFFSGTCRVGAPAGQVVAPAGTIVVNPAGEWHIIENIGTEPLLMFLTVTPNIVPSHTFFNAGGTPYARSMAPLTHP
ncbi:MAG: cupin domain-containing protein [Chloroflexi bacterium]|nr:cupin domain-containing protein [Chloroflexota bacterium]